MTQEENLAELTPMTRRMVEKLLRFAASQGIEVTVAMGYRTCAEQNALYDSGITPARGCRSWHPWGRAVDVRIPGDPVALYQLLGDVWKSWGGVWGGDFGYGDYGHYGWWPDKYLNELCPSGTEGCPLPPWDEDRPFFLRPGGQLILGSAVALGGLLVARRLRRAA